MSIINAVIHENKWRLKKSLIPSGHNAHVTYINRYMTSMIDMNYLDEVSLRWINSDKTNRNHELVCTIMTIISTAMIVDLGIINAWSYKEYMEEPLIAIINNYSM